MTSPRTHYACAGRCSPAVIAILIHLLPSVPVARGALPSIQWDQSTLRLIERGADYGRMARLADGSIACVYDRRGEVCFRRSTDGGATYGDRVVVAADGDCWLTNAFLLPLSDGTLLYLWNERPKVAVAHEHKPAAPGVLTRPFLIRAARSSDLGKTWSATQTLYTAGPSYQDGCWEPAGIQLPSGEVHVYFANEFPYRKTAEQEISLVRSADGGVTWSKAERVGFRADHRDGMPAPLLLKDGTIAVGIEDNGVAGGRFKISVLTSRDNWRTGAVTGEHPNRHPALAEPLPGHVYAGAPFLVQLASGHTVMSCQESDDGTLEHCRMAVYVGDERARGFANRSQPLVEPKEGNQAWNSLFVKDEKTVTAILTATVDGVRGVYSIDGRVLYP